MRKHVLPLLVAVLVTQQTLTAQSTDPTKQNPSETIARLQKELAQAKAQAAKALVEARRARDVAEKERAIAEQARQQAEVESERAEAALKKVQQQRLIAEEARQKALQEARRAQVAEAQARKQAEKAIQAAKRARTAEANNDKVEALKQKRLAVLKEMVALSRKAYEAGEGSVEQLLQASRQLAQAELDLATTGKQRLAIHQKIVALTKDLEKLAESRQWAGRATAVDLLKARSRRIEAEIAFEQAKAKDGANK